MMTERRQFGLLLFILGAIVVAVGATILGLLYGRALGERRSDLGTAVALQSALLARHQLPADLPTDLREKVVHVLADPEASGVFRHLGAEGRLLIARPQGERLESLTVTGSKAGSVVVTPLSDAPGPVARALAGESGSQRITIDDAGSMLSVYAPGARLAIVAMTPLQAIRAPYLYALMIAGAAACAAITAGAAAYFALTMPVRRRLEADLVRWRELFFGSRSGGILVRAAGHGGGFVVVDANPATAAIDSAAAGNVVGSELARALPWTGDDRLAALVQRVWRTGQGERCAPIRTTAESEDLWRSAYAFRLPGDDVAVIYDDITSSKRTETALEESEARWRCVLEMPAVSIMIVDDSFEIRYVNRAAEILFAQSAQELLGAPFGFPVVQGDAAEIEIIRPNRSVIYAQMRAVPLRSDGAQVFLLFIQDVSAFKRAEGELRKLFQAIEQSPASVVITDVQGRIEYVNPKFTETTGYTYPEVVGKNPSILKAGYTPRDEYARLWRTIVAGKVWHGEFYNRKKNGQLFWELASIAPVRDPAGEVTHFVAVKEDITERKATEDRLRISQRMEVIGQLTGGVAHDFNNLLAIIIGNLQLLEETFAKNREARDLIADALWSAERGAQLTHGLLAFGRRQRLNPQVTDVNLIVSEMTDLLRRTLGERIAIYEKLSPGLWKTMIDRGQLENALLNLVVNARDAMADGGTLTIATANAVLPADGGPKTEDAAPGEYIVLSVSDSGVGIPAEVLERIFEPFFTTKKLGEGSGLGLSMVYGFVRQSGGQIVIDSTLGVGTTAKLFLPKAQAEESAEPHAPDARRQTAGRETILVVEDDPRLRKTAVNILRGGGYQVIEAGDANEALHLLDETPQLDLLFSDMVLPGGMSGSYLARAVLERRPDMRILFASGYAADSELSEALPGRVIEMLAKPYRQSDLMQKIRQILDRPPSPAA